MKLYFVLFLWAWLCMDLSLIGADSLKQDISENRCDLLSLSHFERLNKSETLNKILNDQLKSAEDNMMQLKTQLKYKEDQIFEQKKEMNDKIEVIQDKQRKVADMAETIKALQSELSGANGKIERAEAVISDQENELNRRNNQITGQKLKLLILDDHVFFMNITNRDMENKLSICTDDIKLKDSEISDQSKLLKSKDREINDLTINIKNLQSDQSKIVEKKDKEIDDLTKNIKNLRSDQSKIVEKKDKEIDDLTKNIKNLRSDQSKLLEAENKEINYLKKSKENAQSDLMKARNEIENDSKIIKEQEEQLESKNKQLKALNSQIKSSSKKISEMSDKLLRLYPLHSCPRAGPSGIYNITVRGVKTFEAPCNSTGWLTIQKRFDGSEDFNRPWEDYKNGFGNIRGEFFIGLEKLHVMTRDRQHELSIKLGKVDGSIGFVHYDHFEIGSEAESYFLKSVGNHSGEPGDSLTRHVKSKFSTLDRDNDPSETKHCAKGRGGWWYMKCGFCALNGKYYKDGHSITYFNGISWGTWHKYDYKQSLTFSEMMIRPRTVCA